MARHVKFERQDAARVWSAALQVDLPFDRRWRFVPHREDDDGPACEYPRTGMRVWYRRGRVHRDGDLPAIEKADGSRSWYRRGRLHRAGGQPAVCDASGAVQYHLNGWPVNLRHAARVAFERVINDNTHEGSTTREQTTRWLEERQWQRLEEDRPHQRGRGPVLDWRPVLRPAP